MSGGSIARAFAGPQEAGCDISIDYLSKKEIEYMQRGINEFVNSVPTKILFMKSLA